MSAHQTATPWGLERYVTDLGLGSKELTHPRQPVRVAKMLEQQKGPWLRDTYWDYIDFRGDAGDSLPRPVTKIDVSATGSPTIDYLTDVKNGVLQVKHTANSQDEHAGFDFGNHLALPLNDNLYVEFRFKIIGTGTDALGSSDQRFVIGVGTDENNTLDSVTNHAWFRVEGAEGEFRLETDDGTNNNDDKKTGTSFSDDTWVVGAIDFSDLANVKFYLDNVRQLPGTTFDMSNVGSSQNVQPYAVLQKDSGTEQEEFQVDYFMWVHDR